MYNFNDYCIRHIFRGVFIFANFASRVLIREFINTRKYLPPIPTHECDLCTQYIALLDHEFNHSRKCLKVPIREKLDLRNIWRIQYFLLRIAWSILAVYLTFDKRTFYMYVEQIGPICINYFIIFANTELLQYNWQKCDIFTDGIAISFHIFLT